MVVGVLVKHALCKPLSPEEAVVLEDWKAKSDEHRALPDQLRDPVWWEDYRREASEAPSERMWINIRDHIRANPPVHEPGIWEVIWNFIRGWFTKFTILIAGAFMFACCANVQQSKKTCHLENREIIMHNSPLTEILDTISAYYKIAICNPQKVIGISQTGRIFLFDSIPMLLGELTVVEDGAAYLYYREGVIYVSYSPFAEDFIPEPDTWPCLR
jgi:hypothetical protein